MNAAGTVSMGIRLGIHVSLLLASAAALAQPLTIIAQPQDRVVITGTTVAFSVGASGSGFLAFQWRRGTQQLAGATSATLVLPGVNAGQAGDYSAVGTDASGSITSAPA